MRASALPQAHRTFRDHQTKSVRTTTGHGDSAAWSPKCLNSVCRARFSLPRGLTVVGAQRAESARGPPSLVGGRPWFGCSAYASGREGRETMPGQVCRQAARMYARPRMCAYTVIFFSPLFCFLPFLYSQRRVSARYTRKKEERKQGLSR